MNQYFNTGVQSWTDVAVLIKYHATSKNTHKKRILSHFLSYLWGQTGELYKWLLNVLKIVIILCAFFWWLQISLAFIFVLKSTCVLCLYPWNEFLERQQHCSISQFQLPLKYFFPKPCLVHGHNSSFFSLLWIKYFPTILHTGNLAPIISADNTCLTPLTWNINYIIF